MSVFWGPSRSGAQWFSVGLTSSFPDLGLDDGDLSQVRPCNKAFKPGCKVFQVPNDDSTKRTELFVSSDEDVNFSDQVLVFRYRGKFHAVDHVSHKPFLKHRMPTNLTQGPSRVPIHRFLFLKQFHSILKISE